MEFSIAACGTDFCTRDMEPFLTVAALYHGAQFRHSVHTIQFNGILHLNSHALPSGLSNGKLGERKALDQMAMHLFLFE